MSGNRVTVLGIRTQTSLGDHDSAHHQGFEQWSNDQLAALLKTVVGRGRKAKKRNRETGKEAKAIIQGRNAGGLAQGRGLWRGELNLGK